MVDLTTREVATPAPEDVPEAAPAAPRATAPCQVLHGSTSDRPREDSAWTCPAVRPGAIVALLVLACSRRPRRGAAVLPAGRLPIRPSQEVTAEFLVGESGGLEPRKGTAWKVHSPAACTGLYITGAWYKRNLGEDWIKILNDARVAELFVPYHQASYIRYLRPDRLLVPAGEVREEDAGPFGTLMPPFQGDPYPTVVKEFRDRGVVWKDYAHGVRRGKELVIWAALEAGNYMYIMSYAFHDDGTISFRVGATGQNLPGHRTEAHMHSAHWRIDIDLIDGKKNSAMLMRHVEDPASMGAEDIKEPFNGGLRGGHRLGPQGIHHDPGRDRQEERQRQDDRLRPDAACAWARPGTTKSSPGTTSGSAGRIPSGRSSTSSPTCPTS